jgi:drug/metabolite transporter (DMT)-like permease
VGAVFRAHRSVFMTIRKVVVLALIIFCSTGGDFFLKVGMTQVGHIHWTDPWALITALFNPWVALGTVILIIFFVSLMDALSWADLTYVMPSTALGYVLTALVSAWVLHERVSIYRWIGVVVISLAVGVVTGGKPKTTSHSEAA